MFTLPNTITLVNLFLGCAATVFALAYSELQFAFALICAAAVCDFADGLAARLTKQFSRIGGELDSLADVVSFGMAPSAILWTAFQGAESFWNLPDQSGWVVFLVAAFSALRLARFNVEDNPSGDFRGLPTPAAALGIAAACAAWSVSREILIVVVAVVCFLMVSNLRMISLKFKGLGWRANYDRYGLIAAAACLVAWRGVEGVALAIACYVVTSILRKKMKNLLLIISLLFCVGSGAQTLSPWQQPGQPGQTQRSRASEQTPPTEEDTPFFGEGSEVAAEDTVGKPRVKMPLESYHFDFSERLRENMEWTVDKYANHLRIGHIDTLQNDFQRQYPFQRKGVGSAFLGNYGAPSQYLSFFDRGGDGGHGIPDFAGSWISYLRTPENMPFYNVKKPFAQLGYVWAGQRTRQEEDMVVIHAQNISPSTGVNLNYRSLGTKGIYRWQGARDKVFSIGLNHTAKRWTLHAGYIHNSVNNSENGGLVSDDDVLVDINDFEQPIDLPMRMSDAKNVVKSNTFFLVQSYGLALRRVTEEDFTIADRPAVFLGHSIEYSRWGRRYEDTYDGTVYSPVGGGAAQMPYYDDWHFNPRASRDSLFEGRLANRVFVQIQPWDRNGVIGTIDAGIGVDARRYYQFSPDQYLIGTDGREVKQTEYYIYGGANGNLSRYFSWGAKAHLHPFGDAKGDLELSANATARLFIKEKPITLSGELSFTSLDPSFWENNLSTNHFIWDNAFDKRKETRIEAGVEIPHVGLKARVSQSVLDSWVYMGPEVVPVQHSGTVSVTGIYVQEDVKLPIRTASLNFNHRVQLQWSTDQQVVAVPLAAAYLSYFWEFNVVRDVLRLQVGFDGRYNTKYYAPGYNPAVGFYNQREKELGDYVWVDAFVNAKWKRMRIIVKMEHLSDDMIGGRNYFSVLHYPTNRRVLKLGLSWNFYD